MMISCNLLEDNLTGLSAPKAGPWKMPAATQISSVITIWQWHTSRHLLHILNIASILEMNRILDGAMHAIRKEQSEKRASPAAK
jgi:hypothetical protein